MPCWMLLCVFWDIRKSQEWTWLPFHAVEPLLNGENAPVVRALAFRLSSARLGLWIAANIILLLSKSPLTSLKRLDSAVTVAVVR
jgi:hypothetical protein